MLFIFIFLQCPIQVLLLVPRWWLVVVARVWACLVRWASDHARAWSGRAESRNLRRECIVHFILHLWHDLTLLGCVIAWTWVGVELLCHRSVLTGMEWRCSIPLVVELRLIVLIVNTWTYLSWCMCFPKLGLSLCSL